MSIGKRYSLAELEAASGLGRRTIRHYIQAGLVEGSARRGPGASYGEGTLRRLELVKILKDRPVPPLDRPLATGEIRAVLDARGEEGLRWLAEGGSLLGASSVGIDGEGPGRELRDLLASLHRELAALLRTDETPGDPGWERWLRLRRPDLELHLRAPANSSERRRLRRLAADLARFVDPAAT